MSKNTVKAMIPLLWLDIRKHLLYLLLVLNGQGADANITNTDPA